MRRRCNIIRNGIEEDAYMHPRKTVESKVVCKKLGVGRLHAIDICQEDWIWRGRSDLGLKTIVSN